MKFSLQSAVLAFALAAQAAPVVNDATKPEPGIFREGSAPAPFTTMVIPAATQTVTDFVVQTVTVTDDFDGASTTPTPAVSPVVAVPAPKPTTEAPPPPPPATPTPEPAPAPSPEPAPAPAPAPSPQPAPAPAPSPDPSPVPAPSPAPAPAPAPSPVAPAPVTPPSSSLTSDQQGALDAHNAARAAVGTAPLAWDAGLAAGAQAYAQTLAAAHDLVHSGASGLGENLYMSSSTPTGLTDGTNAWISEKVSFTDGPLSGSQSDLHYTQVIWGSTTAVGVASATANDGTVWVVGRYSPQGNIIGVVPTTS